MNLRTLVADADFLETLRVPITGKGNCMSAGPKLQELIRRGTPRDLAQAQELMKSLAGANPDAKPDYRTQALTELNKLESKVILLNEMLDNVDTERGERFAQGDVYDVSETDCSCCLHV